LLEKVCINEVGTTYGQDLVKGLKNTAGIPIGLTIGALLAQKVRGEYINAEEIIGLFGGLAAAYIVGAAAGVAARRYSDEIKKNAEEQAERNPTPANISNLRKAKVAASKAKISSLQKSIAACRASKEPNKCKKIIQDKIQKAKSKIINN